MRAECVSESRSQLGESPCWDPRSHRVYWVDIKGQALHGFDVESEESRTWQLGCRICSVDRPAGWQLPAPRLAVALVGCGDAGLCWLQVSDDRVQIASLSDWRPEPRARFNDGKMGPDGRYWAGVMDENENEDIGALYACSQDGDFSVMDTGYRVPNGPTFSADGTTAYHSDSWRQVIFAFDLGPDGSLKDKREFLRFEEGEGHPDGMATDAEGNLWVAMWDGSRVEVISPGAERIATVPIPTKRPTSCRFVDPECIELFITSAAVGTTAEDRHAGGLFRVRLG